MLSKLFRPQVVVPTMALSTTGVVGFFGGSLGILSWTTVLFIVIAVAAAVALWLVVSWVIRRQQAQGLSDELVRRQERNVAGASPDRRANLQPITEEFRRNIEFLRKMKRKNGIPAIYYLPWYMILGRPASGKSVLLKGSGFRFCVNDTPLKEGGTLHCDWWFTNQGIFLDTAGRLTVHEGGAADKTEWEALLRLLRRFRRKRPIDGVLVTVDANFLLEKTDREIQAYARQLRERIDRTTEFLRLRVPIFVAVTKCDLVEGFKEFFDALPEGALSQIVGWTNDTMQYEGEEQISEVFDGIADRWLKIRPALLEAANSREQRRLMFPFPEEFRNLGEPLAVFMDGVFREDMYTRSPALAGFYFTSGTQEGTTVSRYFRRVGEQLGLAAESLGRTFALGQEQRRPYFVRDLFWKVIAPATGLAVPVDSAKDARRRMLVGVAAAAGAVLFAVLSAVSYARNASYLRAYPERLVEALEATEEPSADDAGGETLRASLAAFGGAADVVHELDRHPFFDNWGLNRRARLRADARELYRAEFERKVWPAFGALVTAELEGNEGKYDLACAERTKLMLGYLGLTGTSAGDEPPAQAAKRLLEVFLPDVGAEEPKDFAKAWSIFGEDKAGKEIDLSAPVRAVADACSAEANPVEALQKIQNDCWPAPAENCFPRLAKIASLTKDVLDTRRKNFEELAKQAGKRAIDEDTAARVKEVTAELRRASGGGRGGSLLGKLRGEEAGEGDATPSGCVPIYFKSIAPDLQALVKEADNYRKSMAKQKEMGAGSQAPVVLAAAVGSFREIEQGLTPKVEILNGSCDESELRAAALVAIARGHVTGVRPALVASRGGKRGGGGGGGGAVQGDFTRAGFEDQCARLSAQKKDLVLGGARPESQARGVAAIDQAASRYASGYEAYWKRELGRSDPAAGADGLSEASDAMRQTVATVAAETGNLQCPTVANLERGPRQVGLLLGTLTTSLDGYGAQASKAAQWIAENVKAGKRAEVVDKTMRGEGPVAELCTYIDDQKPELAPVLRAPVVRQWNQSVLGGMAVHMKTAWQQKTMGVSELTRRFPFNTTGETHASLDVARTWLDPKAGGLVQLYYQLAPSAAADGHGPPCDLRVKSNVGPRTVAFLRGVKAASDVTFGDVDQGKQVQRLTFTFHGAEFAEAGAEEKYGVKMTQVSLALAGQRLAYIMDQPSPRELVVPMPAPSPVNSFVEVQVVGQKRRADVRPARLERGGEWSPLALLKQAERENIPGSDGVRLTWKVPYGSGPPFVLVSFDADARTRRLLETDFELRLPESPEN